MNNEQSRDTAAFYTLTVNHFRLFSPIDLQRLCADLQLSLTPATLARIQYVFRTRELRDPTTGELCFLSALARLFYKMPGSARLCVQQGSPEHLRIFRDLFAKWDALGECTAPTLPEAMDVTSRYLARAGIRARANGLYCGRATELAALSQGAFPSLALELSHTAAALTDASVPNIPQNGMLLLLSPTNKAAFADEIAAFLQANRDKQLIPLATPEQEGLFPHLLRFGGVILDSAAIPRFDPDKGPASLLKRGKGTFLFLAPQGAVSALFATGAPLSLIGTLAPTGKLQIHHGAQNLLSLDLSLLRSMQGMHDAALHLPATTEQSFSDPKFTENADTLLCGTEITSGAEQALLSLCTEAARHGADLSRATLTAALELPLDAGTETLCAALPLLLGYHRAAAELALPAVHHRQILVSEKTPRLSVFLCAPKGAARDLELPCDWQTARKTFFGA